MWIKFLPPPNVLLKIRGSDWAGEWESVGMRKDYKNPRKGKGWRWVDQQGIPISDKVESWAVLDT